MGVVALGSVVMFVPFTQRVFLTRLLGVRTPDANELRRLGAAARIVVAAAGTPRRRFVFAIDESNDINAFACGGHVLVVSSFALDRLDDDELTGVVAHEFSHHLGAHTVGLSFAQWFSLPVLLCSRVGEYFDRIAHRPLRRLENAGRAGQRASQALAFLLATFSWIFNSTLDTARRLNDLVGRDAEFHADRRVVELGFGRQLSRALSRVSSRDGSAIGRSRLERVYSSHPPARTRIARIEALLRARRL
jgi:Zn-dependent protease with chaperone function